MIAAAMPLHGGPQGSGARWVGMVECDQLPVAGTVELEAAQGFKLARFLVRDNGRVRGYVTLPIPVSATELRAAVDRLPRPPETSEPVELPPMSVVVCTRERPLLLAEALRSLVALDYPEFEIVVVDNAPLTDATRAVVAEQGLRYAVAPTPGISFARNVGIAAARHPIVAFTDDDVIADAGWLRGLARGFARGADVACVTGLVPSGELRNDVQAYFDGRVNWSKVTSARVFRLSQPPADLPMFPFCVGEFGTGANFAIRKSVVQAIGGFDEALGVGRRTQGGEDLDIYTSVLFAGHALAVEPTAIIWHRHRDDVAALRKQAIGYGRGLGAWLTKVALHPAQARMALARGPQALGRLMHKSGSSVDDPAAVAASGPVAANPELDAEIKRIARLELVQVLTGPWAYATERWRLRRLVRHGG